MKQARPLVPPPRRFERGRFGRCEVETGANPPVVGPLRGARWRMPRSPASYHPGLGSVGTIIVTKLPFLNCSITVNVLSGLTWTVKSRSNVSVAPSFPQVPGAGRALGYGPWCCVVLGPGSSRVLWSAVENRSSARLGASRLRSVRTVGLLFRGGRFFESGVTTSDDLGTFQSMSTGTLRAGTAQRRCEGGPPRGRALFALFADYAAKHEEGGAPGAPPSCRGTLKRPTLRTDRSRRGNARTRGDIAVIAAAGTRGVLPFVEDEPLIHRDVVVEERVVHAYKGGAEY